MKLAGILALSVAASAAYGQAVVVRRGGSGGYGYDSPYNQLYNRSTQVTLSGRVVGKAKTKPMPNMAEGMNILVRQNNGQTVQVDVGPTWFVKDQFARVNVGDRVRVIGSRVNIGNQRVVLARQIVNSKGRVLALRDLRGNPYWSAGRGEIAQIPSNAVQGTIVRADTFLIDGVNQVGYVVDTVNGPVNMVVAPEWYLNRQDLVFTPGQNVAITGARRAFQAGPYVTVVDSVYTGNNVFVFRNGGVPVWNGFYGGR